MVAYLQKVKTWLDANPDEGQSAPLTTSFLVFTQVLAVLTILIVNVNNLPSIQFQSIYQTAKLDTVSFSPSKSSLAVTEWPSLGCEYRRNKF